MNYNITVIDNLSPQVHTANPADSYTYTSIKDKVRIIKADITKNDVLSQAIIGQNIIVHLAAETGTGQSMYEIAKYTNSNVMGTAILLDLLVNTKHCVDTFIVASSRAIYGEGKYNCTNCGVVYPVSRTNEDMQMGQFNPRCPLCLKADILYVPTDENGGQNPESIYAINKQTQEQMVLTVGRMLGISTVALRYQNVYGPGQSLSNPYTGILSIFSNLLRRNEPVNIFEDGHESRDFVFIDDVIDATVLATESSLTLCNAFNVGSGVPTSVLTVANELKRCYLSESDINITGRYRLGDIRHNVADLRLITDTIGFHPKTDFITGLCDFADWVKTEEPAESGGYSKSIEELASRGLYK
jgi:dTDP-L-rhamnose 4-epimerase